MSKSCEVCGTTDDLTELLIDGRRLCLECLAESYDALIVKNANLKEKLAALRDVIAEITAATISPTLTTHDAFDLVQSILIDWYKRKAADAAKVVMDNAK